MSKQAFIPFEKRWELKLGRLKKKNSIHCPFIKLMYGILLLDCPFPNSSIPFLV